MHKRLQLASIGLFLLAMQFGLLARADGAAQRPRVYRDRVEAHWFDEGNRFWYRNDLPGGKREFIVVDALAGSRAPAFDADRVAEALHGAGAPDARADQLPIDSISFSGDGKSVGLEGPERSWSLRLSDYHVEAQRSAPAGQEFGNHLRPIARAHASRRTGESTHVVFVNRTNGPIKLFWIDRGGSRVSYGQIGAGERHEQQTYGGHVWLVTDADGRELAVFEASDDPALAVVGGAGGARTRPSRPSPDATAPDAPPRAQGAPARAQDAPARAQDAPARAEKPPAGAAVSPDGAWIAYVKDDNLRLRDARTGEERAITHDAGPTDSYRRDVSRDREIEMNYEEPDAPPSEPQVYWAPDSRRFVAMRARSAPERRVFLVQSSPSDQLQPKLLSYPYLKAGDAVPISWPHLFELTKDGSARDIAVPRDLMENPWSIGDVRWAPDSSRFTFLYNQRGHQALRVIAVSADSGKARAIVDERSATFIDYSGKFFCRYLDDSDEIIWMSERDGWNHLYLYDARTGQVKNQITRGPWVVRQVDRVDPRTRQIWFRAGGVRTGQDPYFVHFCRVNFDGSGLVVLTEGDGTHSIKYSPDRRFFIDQWSRVDCPPTSELRRSSDGKLICTLEKADASEVLSARGRFPEPFVAKGRDGQTDIYGVIYRPRRFDQSKKYPVIEDIYAGPQDSYVPKAFRAGYAEERMADHGFIVVRIDGMGTSNRSKAFHDVCWKDLADAGFPDRIAWIKAAAATRPEMDLSRVGIYGGSAGGQNALAGLLFHGDFYKVGVADCGCHDNRMDKIWWNEQWMGWPVGKQYADCSNVTNAWRLQGKLMLFVSELDHNVDPSSTMQVVNALEKANKDFDLVVMTNADHGGAESPYGSRRRAEFFEKNLLGDRP